MGRRAYKNLENNITSFLFGVILFYCYICKRNLKYRNMESIIVWHTGKPISNGRHLVTYSYGGIGQSYAKDGKWTDEEGDFIIAWCHFGDIKEYGE